MSALTKTFVVLLVVLSLLLSSGVIVGVSQIQNFRLAAKTSANTLAAQTAEVTRTKNALGAVEATLLSTQKDLTNALAASDLQAIQNQKNLTALQNQLADAASSARIMQGSLDSSMSALSASEQAKVQLAAVVASTRAANDDLLKKNSDLNLAVSDLTNRVDVATRQNTNLNEQLAQAREDIKRQGATITDMGGKSVTADASATGFGAPPILAYVIRTTQENSMPYATINAGSKDQVKKGMKFQLVDKAKQLYLGELTIESIDESQATGKIEGPHVANVTTNTEARTQL